MFKKFKDKLAEEMKQSPSRLQAGMQQLAQAVISPAASNNLIQDITTSVDDLNLTSEEADTLGTHSETNQFQSVDLQASNTMERSRRSSFSSLTSENIFPSYESPGNLYHLQSDMEQSASEFEESSSSSQLEHITKDELYAGYRKLRTKYTKYRAVYRELYKENMKMKSVLVETQDKALRRIANLKEQCQLEQEAKAHLEEALRNDIEEKDHLIYTLTTKIKLLQANGSNAESSQTFESDRQNEKNSMDLLNDSTNAASSININDNYVAENSALKEKVKKFEVLLAKCNESLKKNKERIAQLTENRDILERDLNVSKNSSRERMEMLESEVYRAKREILSLNEQVDVLKKREEDSALSLAENKLFIHRELEFKEEQNKQLQQEMKKIVEYKDILAEAVVKYDYEFKQFENVINNRSLEIDKKVLQLQELFANKSGAVKLIQQDAKRKFIGADEEARFRSQREMKDGKEGSANNDSLVRNEEISRSRDELEIKNAQLLGMMTELKSCKSTITDLKEMLREVTMDWEQAKREKECLIANILEYKKILGKLRRDCNSVKAEMKQNYSGQKAIIDTMNKKIVTILNSSVKGAKNESGDENAISLAESQHVGEKDLRDSDESLFTSNGEASSVELKTIINENNALRKKCEQLGEQNEQMIGKVNEFDKINSTNIKLIAEIDELNFKLRDIAELQESQDKLQSEMEGLKGKLPFSNTIADNNDHFTSQVSSLKEKLTNYDLLSQDNTALKQELVELKDELAAALNNIEVLKSEQSKNVELGIENFSQKCTGYENTIVNLTSKFTEQTLQLEKLHEELAKQKTNFRELTDRYEIRNSEFKETNDAFAKQASEMKDLNEKYKTQCSEIESLRVKETEILNQLDETVKVRQEMIAKFDELEACKNDIIDTKNEELAGLQLRYENTLKELKLSEELRNESLDVKSNEIEVLTKIKAEFINEIEQLKARNKELEILENDNNAALQLELEKLKANNVEVTSKNKELKDERNNLSKLNAELELSQNKLHQENNKLKDNVSSLQVQLQQLQERLDADRFDRDERISELNEALENTRKEVQAAEAKSAELSETLQVLQSQRSEESALEKDVEMRNESLAVQVSQLQLKLQEFEEVCKVNIELEKRLESLNLKIGILNNVETKNVELLKEIEALNRMIGTSGSSEEENGVRIASEIESLKHNVAELVTHKLNNLELRSEVKLLNESKAESLTAVQGLQEENARLALQFENLQVSANETEGELNLLKDSNGKLLRELETLNFNQSKTLGDKSKTIVELEKRTEDFQNQIIDQRQEIGALRITNEELQDQLAKVNANYSETLKRQTEKIAELTKTVKEFENNFGNHARELDSLKMANEGLQDQLSRLNSDHAKALEDKIRKIAEIEKTAKDFENKSVEESLLQKQEIEAEKKTNKELRDQLAKINSDHLQALEDKAKTITELEKATKDCENKLIGSREEVDGLEAIGRDLREQLMSISQNKTSDQTLIQSYDLLRNENKELSSRLDEAVVLCKTKESQLEILREELKEQTQILTDKLKTNEEEQCMRIKQLVKEFQAQIHDKDEQIQAALEKRFERQQNYESDLIQQYKEQLKDFQVELTAKSEQIESLILDNRETVQAYKDQIEELTKAIVEVKKEHADELQDIDQNWKSIFKQRTDQLASKHVDEVNELTKEWLNERKAAENSDTSPGELESTSRVAMATIQSNTGSFHSLQQTLISQKRELSELRKLLRIRNESLEGSTEIEYLRNILFEYMMGRETLVLTKVISAVVKFDQEQTSKVLKKEEDKLTLLGSLGL